MFQDSIVIKEILNENQPKPVDIEGTKLILSQMENCICKIYINGKKGTGFFSKIPFPDKHNLLHVLITNNHILNENDIANNKTIKLIMYNKEKNENIEKEIKIDESRKRYTYLNDKEGIDITIIEIKPNTDNINNYLEIDDKILELQCEKKSIYVLHYPKEKKLVSYGLIKEIMEGKKVIHFCNTEEGSSGSPIISLDNFKVIGVHYGGSSNINIKFNYGTYIKYIIKEFNNKYKYKNEINLTYFTKEEGEFNIFGNKFVENNRNNIDLIINGIKNNLIEKLYLKKGENDVKFIIKNKITNLEYMFEWCSCLKNIDGLKYLDTKDITNFKYMFCGCTSLSDINILKNWNVSNANNFEGMFNGCSLLSDITELKNWNVSNVNNFGNMFRGCLSLPDINGIKGWNVSKANNFEHMFRGCSSLLDINGLINWDVSNAVNFNYMFSGCSLLSDITGLKNWNVSNANNFEYMFYRCSSLSDINALINWNVGNAKYFNCMFYKCSSLSDINGLKKWNVSNSNNFERMFCGCSSLSDIIGLKNWEVSNANNFERMFDGCSPLLNLKPLQNWKISNNHYKTLK